FFLASCAGDENKDAELRKNLRQIWSSHFTEDFNDSRALDILVVSNRKARNDIFGCDGGQLGTSVDKQLRFGSCKVNVPKNHITGEITYTKDGRQSSHDYFKILESKSFEEKDIIGILKRSGHTPL